MTRMNANTRPLSPFSIRFHSCNSLTLVLFLLIVTAFPLVARDVTILVEDTELGLPLEGAVIRSWDGRQYVCGDDGKAIVPVPDDRQVLIRAGYPGYETGRLLIVMETDTFTLGLRLSGVMESRELVIEAARPGTSETRTGRSVAVSGRDIAQTAEIGIIEDVVSSIKLLPGVGYAGIFDAQPSIRGGFPGDMSASLDGFYVFNPYHWGGGFSIFDPRMVQSAQLSHGVFSSRYGHTISGLLEITSKKPSPTETEVELGVNTSAANFNLSFPLAGRGGFLVMGRVTYYDPFIALAKELAKVIDSEELQAVNSIRVAPYIRSGTITGNYRFLDDLEMQATGFWGMDGVGVTFENGPSGTGELTSSSRTIFDWTNYQGFFNAALYWNPRNNMLLKFSAGVGYEEAVIEGDVQSSVRKKTFSDEFAKKYPDLSGYNPAPYEVNELITEVDTLFNAQGRIDYDWELGKGVLLAAGIQEMFSNFSMEGKQQGMYTLRFSNLPQNEQDMLRKLFFEIPSSSSFWDDLVISTPVRYSPSAGNSLFTTSAYSLVEFNTPGNRFSTEIGLRVDHYFLSGKDFSLQTKPVANPRLNIDFNVFRNRWIFESLDLSAGTGLFSAVNDNVFMAEKRHSVSEMKPNRSWTSVLGTKLEFPHGLVFNIEGYYKYIFDRMYIPVSFSLAGEPDIRPQFDGEGRVWGIDLMLQKLQSRHWDGWLSYSYSWAQYRDPSSESADMGISGGTRGNDWYFPQFHRFHNLNLVLNVRPAGFFNIYARFGLSSGTQLARRIGEGPESYPVFMYDPDNLSDFKFVERYLWRSVRDENNRTTPTLSMDTKFSFFGKSKTGKARHELYFAVENVLSLLYRPQGNTRFNSYTGEIDTDADSAAYGIPIPIPSFGFKISY